MCLFDGWADGATARPAAVISNGMKHLKSAACQQIGQAAPGVVEGVDWRISYLINKFVNTQVTGCPPVIRPRLPAKVSQPSVYLSVSFILKVDIDVSAYVAYPGRNRVIQLPLLLLLLPSATAQLDKRNHRYFWTQSYAALSQALGVKHLMFFRPAKTTTTSWTL